VDTSGTTLPAEILENQRGLATLTGRLLDVESPNSRLSIAALFGGFAIIAVSEVQLITLSDASVVAKTLVGVGMLFGISAVYGTMYFQFRFNRRADAAVIGAARFVESISENDRNLEAGQIVYAIVQLLELESYLVAAGSLRRSRDVAVMVHSLQTRAVQVSRVEVPGPTVQLPAVVPENADE
jgi:hypothetical protein